jgi:hypothetical protein
MSSDEVVEETIVFDSENGLPDMESIFNQWPRTDGPNYFPGPPFAGEAADWYYDDTINQFIMPTNVTMPNTILSAGKFENYTFEATLTSSNQDDDAIGLVMAATIINGAPVILAVVRNQGGLGISAADYGLINYDTSVSDFVPQSAIFAEKLVGDTQGRWAGAETHVKVERAGDQFTVNATRFDDGSDIETFTFNLNDDPSLDKFKGGSSIGFYTQSQPGSTYKNVSMPISSSSYKINAGARVADKTPTNIRFESSSRSFGGREITVREVDQAKDFTRIPMVQHEDPDHLVVTPDMLDYFASAEDAINAAIGNGVEPDRAQSFELFPGCWVWSEVLDQPDLCEVPEPEIVSGWIKGG